MQMMIDKVQDEVLSARMRRTQLLVNELIADMEARNITRDELAEKVKTVEQSLRKTRQII